MQLPGEARAGARALEPKGRGGHYTVLCGANPVENVVLQGESRNEMSVGGNCP